MRAVSKKLIPAPTAFSRTRSACASVRRWMGIPPMPMRLTRRPVAPNITSWPSRRPFASRIQVQAPVVDHAVKQVQGEAHDVEVTPLDPFDKNRGPALDGIGAGL